MLGEEDYEDAIDDRKNIFKTKTNPTLSNTQNDYLEYSTNRSREGKKDRQRKHTKKSCDNCKALKQKISELEQLNEELVKIKEKLSKANEDLYSKNQQLSQTNLNIINKNKELLALNNQLKEEKTELINKNNELIEEKSGYKNEISGLKKQLISKINELSTISKEKEMLANLNLNKQDLKSSNVNVDILSLNSDSIPPKKEELAKYNINNAEGKYCTIDEYIELKSIVDDLKEKIDDLQKWKKSMITISDKNKRKSKSKDKKNVSADKEKKESSIKHYGHRKIDFGKKADDSDHLSKSLIIEQKLRNNFASDPNISTSNITNGYNVNYESSRKENIKMDKSFFKKDKDRDSIKSKGIDKLKNGINNKQQRFNSKIMTNIEDLDLIARGLVKDNLESLKQLKVGYKLIYRATEHGETAEEFHDRCDNVEGTLTVVKTKEGNIFGGYTSISWDPEEYSEKKDDNAFVFSLNLKKLYFESGKRDCSIFCDSNKGPCFVGMFAISENILDNKCYINPFSIQCYSGESYSFEINQGKTEFYVEELEVFQVIKK